MGHLKQKHIDKATKKNFSEKLVKSLSIISKAVLKQKASEHKNQMTIYKEWIESILDQRATLRDIFNICEVKKQPVIKIQTNTSDPSDSKKAKKTAKKK